MLAELCLATLMVVLTVTIHGVGLFGMARVLRIEMMEEAQRHIAPLSFRSIGFTVLLVLALFVLHGLEIWSYAFVYEALDAVPDLRTAVYFSTSTYAAIGFSDSMLDPDWQLFAAIEGVNGVILLGWSTAFFVTFVSRLGRR